MDQHLKVAWGTHPSEGEVVGFAAHMIVTEVVVERCTNGNGAGDFNGNGNGGGGGSGSRGGRRTDTAAADSQREMPSSKKGKCKAISETIT